MKTKLFLLGMSAFIAAFMFTGCPAPEEENNHTISDTVDEALRGTWYADITSNTVLTFTARYFKFSGDANFAATLEENELYSCEAKNGTLKINSLSIPYTLSATAGLTIEGKTYTKTKPKVAVPTGVAAVALSHNSIKITWNAVPGADKYFVSQATSETGTFFPLGTTGVAAPSTEYIDTGYQLMEHTTYYYKVTAAKTGTYSDEKGDDSAVVSATTQWNETLEKSQLLGAQNHRTRTGVQAGETYRFKIAGIAGESVKLIFVDKNSDSSSSTSYTSWADVTAEFYTMDASGVKTPIGNNMSGTPVTQPINKGDSLDMTFYRFAAIYTPTVNQDLWVEFTVVTAGNGQFQVYYY
jgi:hypothetical protein